MSASLNPCKSHFCKATLDPQSKRGFSSTAGGGEVSYPNNSQGQSQEQREKGVYRVSAHSKLEDYLWICSRTGSAGRDRRLTGGGDKRSTSCAKTDSVRARQR